MCLKSVRITGGKIVVLASPFGFFSNSGHIGMHILAAQLGFEPRLDDPESSVLPLDDRAYRLYLCEKSILLYHFQSERKMCAVILCNCIHANDGGDHGYYLYNARIFYAFHRHACALYVHHRDIHLLCMFWNHQYFFSYDITSFLKNI